jgi:hypothetical protein
VIPFDQKIGGRTSEIIAGFSWRGRQRHSDTGRKENAESRIATAGFTFEQDGSYHREERDDVSFPGVRRREMHARGRIEGNRLERTTMSEQALIEKIQKLSAERVEEVEDFVDFLLERDGGMTRSATLLAEAAFERVWDNPEDAVYDDL